MVDPKTESSFFSSQGWLAKFRFAIRGLILGVKDPSGPDGQNSFLVHIPCSIAVIVGGIWIQVGWVSMAILVICIGMVFVAELVNSSLEELSRAVTKEQNAKIGAALDIAAGSVLLASLTAVVVGVLVFAPHIIALVGW